MIAYEGAEYSGHSVSGASVGAAFVIIFVEHGHFALGLGESLSGDGWELTAGVVGWEWRQSSISQSLSVAGRSNHVVGRG